MSWIELEDWVEAIVLWTKKMVQPVNPWIPRRYCWWIICSQETLHRATFARNVRLTKARFVVLATLAHKHFQM